MTHPPISLASLPDSTQTLPYTSDHTYWRHTHAILMISYSWKRFNPNTLSKFKIYDRVNIIFLERASPARKCDVIITEQRRHRSFYLRPSPKLRGTVEFFLNRRFQISKVCIEPKYSLQIIALFLNWKQSKKISNDQELIQSDPISCPQNQKGNN